MNVPYIPGSAPPTELPLGRFLPPIPEGMASAWCQQNLKPGDWVLEPFGFSPLMAIEIASAGFPVLVCVNNPIHAFLLDVLCAAPQAEDLTAALQDLAIASKGSERMEPYIRGLYRINCTNCSQSIEAEGFLWKKDASQPYAALINCPYCGARGERPLDEDALDSLTRLPPKELHLARALNRIAERDDLLRAQVENVLNAYPARPLIILQTIINRLESIEQTAQRRELLIALILSAADRGNTLWAYPSPRHRPRQVVVPSVYLERNLWLVLEEAVTAWQVRKTSIPLTDWQGVPEQPAGIYKYQGRIRELSPAPPEGFFAAVLAAIPRPNQAFWSLSALWTGWIWGQDAVGPIRQVLSRQRYDWNWHCQALMGVFDAIQQLNHAGMKFWGLIPENEPMLLLAALLAGETRGFQLNAYAQSSDDQLAQCSWTAMSQPKTRNQPDQTLSAAREAARAYLQKKGEPASFQQVHAAIITALAGESKLGIEVLLENINQGTSETQRWLETLFNEADFLTRVTGDAASLETGDWWLTHPQPVKMRLIDTLEEQIYHHLISSPTTNAETVKKIAYGALPGIFTPDDDMILNCLASYASLVDPEAHLWTLRQEETPQARSADEKAIRISLNQIAGCLGYHTEGTNPLYWSEQPNGPVVFKLNILTTAILSPFLTEELNPAVMKILVIPGGRANLLAYKQQRDPVLKAILAQGYQVVKFRLVRDLAANPLLTRDLLTELIQADPPEYHAHQLALL